MATSPSAGFFDALRQDPLLSRLKLIAEPWDLGPGGYQLGNHAARLLPNGTTAIATPRAAYWRGDPDQARRIWRGGFPARPMCSGMARGGPGPASISSPAHDGLTLEDLVSYNDPPQ